MATENELLETLNTEQAAIGTSDLAEKVKASVEGTRKQLKRLKDKGCVEGDSQEGWAITEEGKKTLETGGVHPSMVEEGVTPRQKFEAIGRLIGITSERIKLATDIVWSGEHTDIKWVWDALRQSDIRDDLAKIWTNSWRAHLKKGIPPELAPLLAGAEKEAGAEAAVEKGRGGVSYRLDENDVPFYVGEGLGDLTYKDAVDLAKIRAAARRPVPGAQPSTPQTTTADEILKIVTVVKELTGEKGQKSYVVTQGEQGAVVREVESGQPLVVPGPTASRPVTYVVDGAEVRELKPGEPLVIKKEAAAPPTSKTFVVRQTSEGIVAEEHDLSKPIIINPSPSPSLPGFPFPVMDSEGKPVLGSDGQPVYANIEPMLKYMGFQGEQRRADERHVALMGLAQTVKENLPAGIEAFRRAVGEVKGAPKSAESEAPAYECGKCHTKFTLPRVPGDEEKVICPNPECGQEWTGKELTG